ncbi:MAG: hypothetical protein Q7R35_05000 [Elusimicrobiota bacterium]|nr:hypothetical protein [Elusimicrobiota bacterium]
MTQDNTTTELLPGKTPPPLSREDYWDYEKAHVPGQVGLTVMTWAAACLGILSTGAGWSGKNFGGTGIIAFLVLAIPLLLWLSKTLNDWSNLQMAREIAKRSAGELRAVIAETSPGCWSFRQNLALYQLLLHGEEIESLLPRVLGPLTSDLPIYRASAFEALRFFPGAREQLADYDPLQSVEKCRTKIAAFRGVCP